MSSYPLPRCLPMDWYRARLSQLEVGGRIRRKLSYAEKMYVNWLVPFFFIRPMLTISGAVVLAQLTEFCKDSAEGWRKSRQDFDHGEIRNSILAWLPIEEGAAKRRRFRNRHLDSMSGTCYSKRPDDAATTIMTERKLNSQWKRYGTSAINTQRCFSSPQPQFFALSSPLLSHIYQTS